MELGNLIVLLSLLSVSCWICLVDSRSTAPSGPSINSRRRPVIHQQRFDHRYNNHNKKRQHVDHRKQESPRHPQRPPPDVVRRLPIRPVGPATRRHPQQTAKTPTLVGHKKFEFELGRPVDDFLSNFPDVNEVQFEIGNLQGLMPNVYRKFYDSNILFKRLYHYILHAQLIAIYNAHSFPTEGMKPPVMTKPARPDNDDQYRYRNQPPADANEDHQQAGPENDGHIKPFWGPPLTSPTPSHHRPSSVTPRILATASSPTTEPNNRKWLKEDDDESLFTRCNEKEFSLPYKNNMVLIMEYHPGGRDGEDIQKTIDDFRSTLLKHPGSADGVLKPGTHQTNGKEKDGGSLYHHDEEDENSNHFDDQKKMPVVPDHSSVKQPSPSAGPGSNEASPFYKEKL